MSLELIIMKRKAFIKNILKTSTWIQGQVDIIKKDHGITATYCEDKQEWTFTKGYVFSEYLPSVDPVNEIYKYNYPCQ